MNKICFYIMVSDTGFAPNPFHGFCTLALCTPNHMRARLVKDDWIIGCFRSGKPPLVVYVMQIEKVLRLDEYYRNPRYACKKPSNTGCQNRVGDNIYYLDSGVKQQDPMAKFHQDMANQKKDWRGDRVFIAPRFTYFGNSAISLPEKFHDCLPKTQGIKYLFDNNSLYRDFVDWNKSFEAGVLGFPRDQEKCTPDRCRGCET